MNTRQHRLPGLFLSLIATFAITANAGGIYKWVDENGGVHFGEKPPSTIRSQPVTVTGTAPSSDAAAAQKRLDDIRAAAVKPVKNVDEAAVQDEETRKKIARNCEVYRNNLETMKNNPRVKETLPNGEMAFIGEDEKAKRMASTEKLIAEHCKDAGTGPATTATKP